MLTGKCKEDFEKWYEEEKFIYHDETEEEIAVIFFNVMPFSMKYGVYVDFFDSVGVYIEVHPWVQGIKYGCNIFVKGDIIKGGIPYEHKFGSGRYDTRNEARQKAIEKACELYNIEK